MDEGCTKKSVENILNVEISVNNRKANLLNFIKLITNAYFSLSILKCVENIPWR